VDRYESHRLPRCCPLVMQPCHPTTQFSRRGYS
jgi:hypothetical protein